MEKRSTLIIVLFVLVLIALNYSFLDSTLEKWVVNYDGGFVERVIDGDTAVVNGTSVRLLGINTPEKGEEYSELAKEFLENKTLNKLVRMKKGKDDTDLYNRKLRYIFVGGENVNLELVRNGYANYYFPSGKDEYYEEFVKAWDECIVKNKNLCEVSYNYCSNCISAEIDVSSQTLVLENTCPYECNLTSWEIKDEGRKKFVFGNFILKDSIDIKVGDGVDTDKTKYWRGKNYVWTKSGDTMFLRDSDGRLVLWKGL